MKRLKILRELVQSFLGSIFFYSIVALPSSWMIDLSRIARWSPIVGLILGIILSLLDYLLVKIDCPKFLASVLIVAFWLFFTGGLHLDGVIDSADGLAVEPKERRLEVMSDSHVGAFGVMAALLVLILKIAALSDLENYKALILLLSPGWGRWAQVLAIAQYPYLKKSGKGHFHKESIRLPIDILIGPFFLILVSILIAHQFGLLLSILGITIAYLVSWWYYKQFSGHTGDTYGAVVEWSEAIFLALSLMITHFHR